MEATRVYVLLFMMLSLAAPAWTEDRQAQVLWNILQIYQQNSRLAEAYEKTFISQSVPAKRTFPCVVLPPTSATPTSVHKLRPGDVKVIAALGDSLTAGRGVQGGYIGLLMDFRGLSWSIGGDDNYAKIPTLPNILRQYNPYLYGFSNGVGMKNSRFNVAKSGAISSDLLGEAQELVRRMQADKNINMATDWKVITVFIGANDLCDFCQDEVKYSVASYKSNLQTTLDYLQEHVPRSFVNLVEVMNLEFVQNLPSNFICDAVHKLVCDCASNAKSPENKAKLIKLRQGYQAAARELATSGRYDVREDFTVVLQPLFENTSVPTQPSGQADMSYFARDCFHLSEKGQVAAAEGLWNNMVEPVGKKRTSWSPGEVIECPTEASPYLYTAKNSQTTPAA